MWTEVVLSIEIRVLRGYDYESLNTHFSNLATF